MFLSGLVQHVGQALIKYINNWRLIMYKLVLNVGDYVRNINETSRRYRCRGIVTNVSENSYYVEYSNGIRQSYQKESAHNCLEKIGNASSQCKCVPDCDEVCDKCVRQMQKMVLQHRLYSGGIQTLAEACGK